MIALILILLCLIVYYFIYKKLVNILSYWKKMNVKGPTLKQILKFCFSDKDTASLLDEMYHQYANEKLIGVTLGWKQILLIRDPDLIKNILVRDFDVFARRNFIDNMPLIPSLFALEGDEWKILRQQISPMFTTSKLKHMFLGLNNCVEDFMKYLDTIVKNQVPHEIRRLTRKYTMKTTTAAIFGIEIDTFRDESSIFVKMSERFFKRLSTYFKPAVLLTFLPGLFKFNDKNMQECANFFSRLVQRIGEERTGQPKTGKDFMDLLLELKEQGVITKEIKERMAQLQITEDIVTAQAVLFYISGFRPTSQTLSALLYELAVNPNVQEHCHEEIRRVMEKYNNKLTFESINELKYVSMALDEVLRKHSEPVVLYRECTRNYNVPGINIVIEKGTKLFLYVKSIHNDPKYFPDPEKFDPERFAPENSIQSGTYQPFGQGPRSCIAQRFSRLLVILGIAHFLYKYKIAPSEQTLRQEKIGFIRKEYRKIPEIWLNIERRSDIIL